MLGALGLVAAALPFANRFEREVAAVDPAPRVPVAATAQSEAEAAPPSIPELPPPEPTAPTAEALPEGAPEPVLEEAPDAPEAVPEATPEEATGAGTEAAPAAAGEGAVAGESDFRSLLDAADLAGRQRRYADAEGLLTQALAQRPDDFEVTYQMALTLVRLRRRDEAHEWLRKAVALNGTSPLPWLLEGDVFLQEGKRRDAIRAWTRCLSVRPGFASCQERLARANRR